MAGLAKLFMNRICGFVPGETDFAGIIFFFLLSKPYFNLNFPSEKYCISACFYVLFLRCYLTYFYVSD